MSADAIAFPGVQTKMTVKRLSVACLSALWMLALAGCTTETWYESFKQSSENRCRNQPPGESQRCLEALNQKGYQEYEKERTGQKP